MVHQSPTIAKVMAGELCAGCGLCAGVSDGAVVMKIAPPGYARPQVEQSVPDAVEAKIAAACPGNHVAAWPRTGAGHIVWGPYRTVGTGHATDPEIRYAGSSGGMLSALAIEALDSGLVDQIVHITADPDRPTHNIIQLSTGRTDVLAAAGSRYGASSPLESVNALLASDRRYAIIAKPCDISALRLLGEQDDRVAVRFPLMMSFFCGGVPSLAGSDRIIRAMGLRPEAVVRFRYRGMGWPGRARAETGSGQVGEMGYHESWGGQLSKEVQFRCKICPDAVGGVADIACADAWYGGDDGYPKFEEEDGRSLVIARTEIGQQLIDRAIGAGACAVEPVDVTAIDLMQPSQARRKHLIGARTLACRLAMQPVPGMTGLDVAAASRRSDWADWLRNLAGTGRRIALGKR